MCARYASGVCLVTHDTVQGSGGGGGGGQWVSTRIAFSSTETQTVPNVYGLKFSLINKRKCVREGF